MIPLVFRKVGVIGWLNVAAFSFVLSAGIGTAFSTVNPGPGLDGPFAQICALVTLALGPFWAVAMRAFPIAFRKGAWRGWLVCCALALVNAGIAGATYLALINTHAHASHPIGDVFASALMGGFLAVTFGVVFWGPALVATTLMVGLPTAWAKRLARRGLAGEERGEWILGTLFVALSLAVGLASPSLATARHPTFYPLAIAASVSGGCAALLAIARELRRRRFVRDAELGKIPGYRVTQSQEGRVLVRVASVGSAYRASDIAEEMFALEERAVLP